jgi:hypothetical protein
LVGVLLASVLNLISSASPPAERQVFLGMLANADTIEALTVRSSISAAVDFDTLGLPGWHMWTPGSDLLENEYVLRTAAPALPKLRVALIAIPPVAFQSLNTDCGASDVRRLQFRAAGPRLADGTIDGDWLDLAIAWALPLVRDDQWRDPVALLLGWIGLPIQTPSGLMARGGRWLPLLRAEDRQRRRAEAAPAAAPLFACVLATLAADPGAPSRLAEAPPRIARLLATRGVRAVFYTPPVSPEYEMIYDTRRPSGVLDGRDEMRRIAAADGLIYIDLSRNPALERDLDPEFYDPIHLTVRGAVRYTRWLRREMEARGALPLIPPAAAPPR